MARLVNPKLYPHDIIASYFTYPSHVSPIVKALYWAAAHIMDPVRFSQFLPLILVVIATLFLFKTSESYGGARYAFWISFSFNLYIWIVRNLPGGLSRAFFYPLLFLFLWLLITKRWRLIILCFILQALIYPTVFFLSLGLLTVELLLDRKTGLIKQAQILLVLLGVITSFLILTHRYAIATLNNFGTLITNKEAMLMPEFYADGRVKVFPIPYKLVQDGITLNSFFNFLKELVAQKTIFCIEIVGLIVVFITLILMYKRFIEVRFGKLIIPKYIWSLTGVSTFLCAIAYIFLFYFYIPHRYIYYILPLIFVFLTGAIFEKIESINPSGRYIAWILACIILIFTEPFWKEDLIKVSPKEKVVYDYLKTLPDDSVIAAPVKLSDNIPVFSKKSVFVRDRKSVV